MWSAAREYNDAMANRTLCQWCDRNDAPPTAISDTEAGNNLAAADPSPFQLYDKMTFFSSPFKYYCVKFSSLLSMQQLKLTKIYIFFHSTLLLQFPSFSTQRIYFVLRTQKNRCALLEVLTMNEPRWKCLARVWLAAYARIARSSHAKWDNSSNESWSLQWTITRSYLCFYKYENSFSFALFRWSSLFREKISRFTRLIIIYFLFLLFFVVNLFRLVVYVFVSDLVAFHDIEHVPRGPPKDQYFHKLSITIVGHFILRASCSDTISYFSFRSEFCVLFWVIQSIHTSYSFSSRFPVSIVISAN